MDVPWFVINDKNDSCSFTWENIFNVPIARINIGMKLWNAKDTCLLFRKPVDYGWLTLTGLESDHSSRWFLRMILIPSPIETCLGGSWFKLNWPRIGSGLYFTWVEWNFPVSPFHTTHSFSWNAGPGGWGTLRNDMRRECAVGRRNQWKLVNLVWIHSHTLEQNCMYSSDGLSIGVWDTFGTHFNTHCNMYYPYQGTTEIQVVFLIPYQGTTEMQVVTCTWNT